MAKNTVEIILAARDQASQIVDTAFKEVQKATKDTTMTFGTLNSSLKKLGLDSAEIDKLNKEIKQVNPKILEVEMENVRNQLKKLGADSAYIDKVTKELKEAEKVTKEVEKTANSSFSSITSNVSRSISLVAGAITGLATGAIVKLGIGFNSSMENAQIGFTTMLGSAEKAKTFLADLQAFAAKTPFEFPELRDAAGKMLAFGFAAKDVVPMLTAVGDAAAATGRGQQAIDSLLLSMGQMKATGRASWEEIKQMGENGIPALQMLADSFGVTTREMMKMLSDGAVPADKAITILTDGMNKRYGGMMKNMEKTFTGMVSNIKDSANFLIGAAFEPIFINIRDKVLPTVQSLVSEMQDGFKNNGVAGALQAIIPSEVAEKLKQAEDSIKNIKDLIASQDWQGLGLNIGQIFSGFLSDATDFGVRIAEWVKQQIAAVDWSEVGKASVSVAAGFILGFANGIFDPVVWWEILSKYWDEILLIIISIVAAPAKVIGKLGEALAKVPLVGEFAQWLLKSTWDIGRQVLGPIGNFFKDMATSFFGSFMKGIGLEGVNFLPVLTGIIRNGIESIASFGETIYLKGLELMQKLGLSIAEHGPVQVVGAIKNLVHQVDLNLSLMVTRAVEIGAKFVSVISGAVVTVVRITTEALTGLAKSAFEWGKNIIEGLGNGLMSMFDWLMNKARSIASAISSTIKKALDINSPSRVMFELGKYTGEGLALGMDSTLGRIKGSSEDMAFAAIPAISSGNSSSSTAQTIAKSQSSPQIIQHYHFAEGSVIIPAKDLAEMRSIQDFFNRFPQAARAVGVRL
jgi:tape measure domain-containing protein